MSNSEIDTLLQRSEKAREIILKYFNKTENDLKQDVEYIQEWLKTQPHLPEEPEPNTIEYFIVSNKFSLENTKQKIDAYYTLRFPLYEILRSERDFKETWDMAYAILLPKLVDDRYRVLFIKHKDIPASKYEQESIMMFMFNLFEIRMREDLVLSDILVVDYEHFTFAHTVNLTPKLAKIIFSIFEKVFNGRMKAIHLINPPSFINVVLNLIKPLMKKKIRDRIILHPNLESIREHIPFEVLPKDYGGKERSLDELQELWKLKYKTYEDYFQKQAKLKVDETLRPTLMKDIDIFGLQGSFKKLEFD